MFAFERLRGPRLAIEWRFVENHNGKTEQVEAEPRCKVAHVVSFVFLIPLAQVLDAPVHPGISGSLGTGSGRFWGPRGRNLRQ